jgi:hypothetical protein
MGDTNKQLKKEEERDQSSLPPPLPVFLALVFLYTSLWALVTVSSGYSKIEYFKNDYKTAIVSIWGLFENKTEINNGQE